MVVFELPRKSPPIFFFFFSHEIGAECALSNGGTPTVKARVKKKLCNIYGALHGVGGGGVRWGLIQIYTLMPLVRVHSTCIGTCTKSPFSPLRARWGRNHFRELGVGGLLQVAITRWGFTLSTSGLLHRVGDVLGFPVVHVTPIFSKRP